MRRTSLLVGARALLGAAVLSTGSLNFLNTSVSSASTGASGFSSPDAIAVSASDVWVANVIGNSVAEFNVASGSLVRVINAKADGFHRPEGIAVNGSHVWVTNSNQDLDAMGTARYPLATYSSITELNANNGSLVRVINRPADHLVEPGPIAICGSHVWVVNDNATANAVSSAAVTLVELNDSNGSLVRLYRANVDGLDGLINLTATRSDVWLTNLYGPYDSKSSVTELNARTGSLVRIVKAQKKDPPDPVSVDGSHVWIGTTLMGSNSVTELNARTGSLVRIIKAKADHFNGLSGIAAQGSHVWVTNSGALASRGNTNSVTELNARTGSLVRIIKAKADGFNRPSDVVASGSKLWVLNFDSITELNQNNGSLVRVIR
ncbi:MAG TPA: hypothetical protein VMU68_11385 [Acidimicrobiales bacterium]|jgi:hypothetical protein|nr:hypothetical protein [Acidimicrobiales bacterium]